VSVAGVLAALEIAGLVTVLLVVIALQPTPRNRRRRRRG
jgi:hypothetical protein